MATIGVVRLAVLILASRISEVPKCSPPGEVTGTLFAVLRIDILITEAKLMQIFNAKKLNMGFNLNFKNE
jgi:hypothetical protein